MTTQEPNRSTKSFGDASDIGNRAELLEKYGQVRTMADVLISMNERQHFSNSRDAVNAVEEFVRSQNWRHVAISKDAFDLIVDALYSPTAFVDGKLNKDAFLQNFTESQFEHNWENAVYRYCYAKIWKLIRYFNEFRRYTSPDQIYSDLKKSVTTYRYYDFAAGIPLNLFRCAIEKAWGEIAPNNSINPNLLEKYMFKNHEESVKTIGLEATIRKDFVQNPCYADVFSPQKVGTAPFYHRRQAGGRKLFFESCGHGMIGLSEKVPNANPELFEFKYAYKLLLADPKYTVLGRDSYGDFEPCLFVPKEDMSLPVYYCDCYNMGGKMLFENEEDKKAYIENAMKQNYIMGDKDRMAGI